MQLVRYDAMRHELMVCRDIDEVKEIADKASKLQAYAKQRHDPEMELWVSEIRLRATRRIGELSAELESSQGARTELRSTGETKLEALKKAGLSKAVAHRCEKIAGMPEEEFDEYLADKLSRGQAVTVTDALRAVTAKNREARNKEKLETSELSSCDGLYLGDFRREAAIIPANSIDLVFTDPPYDRGSIGLYEDAAREAERILKPGGSLISYCGQVILPEVLPLMSKHLRYWWTAASINGGGQQLLQKLGLRCGWKPVLWFVKGTRGDVSNVIRDTVTGSREKFAHPWQQSEAEATFFINELCSPAGTVVDFFVGSGTTCIAAEQLGRKWVGFEIDEESFQKASARLNEYRQAA